MYVCPPCLLFHNVVKFYLKSPNLIWNRQIRFEIAKLDLILHWNSHGFLVLQGFLPKNNLIMQTSWLYKIPKFKWDFRKVFNPLCVWYEDDGCRRPAGRQISLNYFSTYAQWEFGVTSFQFGWIQLILEMFGTSPNLRTNNLGNYLLVSIVWIEVKI